MSQVQSGTKAEQIVSDTDHVQLSRLVNEHAWRVDHGRADTVHELYIDEGELTLPSGTVRGRDALRAWGREIVEAAPWHVIRHVCGNMRFVTDGPDAAHGTTVLMVYLAPQPGAATTLPFSVGEDHDRFVRTEQGWRIASRVWVELFARGDGITLPSQRSA